MPKIPKYSPIHSEEPYGGYKWKHDEQEGLTVEVTKNIGINETEDDAFWRVEIWDYAHLNELGPISKNKEDMREVAVDWMKNHRGGWKHKD